MAIYFLRHGESEANLVGIFAGQKEDSPLTELGIQQARIAADELKSAKIDRIITSTLKRAYQTARIVAEKLGLQVEIDDRIIEYDMGALSGTPIRKVTSQELVSSEGAEDPMEFKNRILSLFRQYKDSDETILIVSHAGVDRMIEAIKQGFEPGLFYGLPPCPNAHAFELDLSWLN